MVHDRPSHQGLKVTVLLESLSNVIGLFSANLKQTFWDFSKSRFGEKEADDFLLRACSQLAVAYFPSYAGPCAEYLTRLLENRAVDYGGVVFKIVSVFLCQENAILYIDSFRHIIQMAHDVIAQGEFSDRLSSSAPSLPPSLTPSFSSSSSSSSSTSSSLAAPAATLVTTAVLVFKYFEQPPNISSPVPLSSSPHANAAPTSRSARAQSVQELKRRSISERRLSKDRRSSVLLQALPHSSIRYVIGALRQVVASSPMFPKQ
eukprot:TRINITY_DN3089_c0_g1_i6.p1 TRINITY_DN3089_c0_g1~~TRINITY_DN3089_c0_g1_i6.p1  ORF type:complete len:261 (-),score=66.69 TRINITY_DN3089_c0_g1_i6:387-1169(-)